jgi:hypothetical protein
MVAFVNAHRDQYGVEPICAVLPMAPSTYYLHQGRSVDPSRRSTRAQRDDALRVEIQRVWDANYQCTVRARSGGSCAGRATTWPGARWSV